MLTTFEYLSTVANSVDKIIYLLNIRLSILILLSRSLERTQINQYRNTLILEFSSES